MIPIIDSLCPLAPALRRLLQACVDCDSTDTDVLAGSLFLSAETVYTYFKRIRSELGIHDRGAAVIIALKRGWITLPPPAIPPPRKK